MADFILAMHMHNIFRNSWNIRNNKIKIISFNGKDKIISSKVEIISSK